MLDGPKESLERADPLVLSPVPEDLLGEPETIAEGIKKPRIPTLDVQVGAEALEVELNGSDAFRLELQLAPGHEGRLSLLPGVEDVAVFARS
jgi:hypothetical protein